MEKYALYYKMITHHCTIVGVAGLLLGSMAKAVEKASVVLMCYSKKYKGSTNCRTEITYAHTLQKRIIPLRMEADYKPDNWLGPLAMSHFWYDFSTPEKFESEWNKLENTLKKIQDSDARRKKVEMNEVLKQKFQTLHKLVMEHINEDGIKTFLVTAGVIEDSQRPANGRQLLQLLYTSGHPEAFIQLYLAIKEQPQLQWLVDQIDPETEHQG